MSDLEEFEAIKQVKYKYQRYVDTKNFEGLAEVLTEDAVAAYDSGKYLATGRKAIIEFLASALQRDDIATLHQVHCPELTLTSSTSATGVSEDPRIRSPKMCWRSSKNRLPRNRGRR